MKLSSSALLNIIPRLARCFGAWHEIAARFLAKIEKEEGDILRGGKSAAWQCVSRQ